MAVVNVENDENRDWFAQHLKTIISGDRAYTFISDRHSELLKAIQISSWNLTIFIAYGI